MLFISLLNAVKNYFEKARIRKQFRYLDNHTLKDIGFYRDNGNIFPLAGKQASLEQENKDGDPPPTKG
ncbi:hypothetical protein CBF23_007875 [Marinomonas agarivorans]|nr:hypothetical protein CBF23_007875 [Marinomonas agarivorans]